MHIQFYKTSSGREPVREALEKLPTDERKSALVRLDGIEKHGLDYSRVAFKPIGGKLWEIKYRFRNQHRILYCMQGAETMVLLHYVKKKTQKLEVSDKTIAEKRLAEVMKHE